MSTTAPGMARYARELMSADLPVHNKKYSATCTATTHDSGISYQIQRGRFLKNGQLFLQALSRLHEHDGARYGEIRAGALVRRSTDRQQETPNYSEQCCRILTSHLKSSAGYQVSQTTASALFKLCLASPERMKRSYTTHVAHMGTAAPGMTRYARISCRPI